MDTRTGEIKFFKNDKELKKAKNKNPDLKEVKMTKDSNCNKCNALYIDKGEPVCRGGSRKNRREQYNCRVRKIIK